MKATSYLQQKRSIFHGNILRNGNDDVSNYNWPDQQCTDNAQTIKPAQHPEGKYDGHERYLQLAADSGAGKTLLSLRRWRQQNWLK